jgi:hypothetical protein
MRNKLTDERSLQQQPKEGPSRGRSSSRRRDRRGGLRSCRWLRGGVTLQVADALGWPRGGTTL